MSSFGATRPVGEVFTDENGVTLKVEECLGCYLGTTKCHYLQCINCYVSDSAGLCSEYMRTDKKSVIFVEVKGGQQ